MTPGVGDYDITRFKSLGKVDPTKFTCSNPPTIHSIENVSRNGESKYCESSRYLSGSK